jgi:prephenate dehydrogenase
MTVGVIGFGTFGRFMCGYLKRYGEVVVYNRTDRRDEIERFGLTAGSVEEALAQPIVILAISVQAQEAFWREHGAKVNPDALVIDVSSVKVKPVELMQKYLPKSCQILATHPLFGPQSGKDGIAGLSIVIWPVRLEETPLNKIMAFLQNELELKIIRKTPQDHDKDMAYVQALTFFIGRAIGRMGLPDTELATKTYQHLFDIEQIVGKDTDELFLTIQQENPYADEIRKELVAHLEDIEGELAS